MPPLVLGASADRCALAEAVAEMLRARSGLAVDVEELGPASDRPDAGNALEPLTAGSVDLLLVGGELLPPEDPDGFGILAVLPRADRGDALVVRGDLADAAVRRVLSSLESIDPRDPFLALPPGPRLGVQGALRRAAFEWLRGDARVSRREATPQELLAALDDAEFDGVIVPLESLRALGRVDQTAGALPPPWLTAAGSGALVVVGPWRDALRESLLPIDDRAPRLALIAERALAAALGPLGLTAWAAEAHCKQTRLDLSARVFLADGGPPLHGVRSGEASARGALRLAAMVARELIESGGARLR